MESDMAETRTLLALFDDINPAADAIEVLRQMGIEDDQMNVISGIPVTEAMLGRPRLWSNVPRLALGGTAAGFLIGVFFAVATPMLYPVLVGGQPLISVPPSIVVIFEMSLLGMLVSTFVGVFLDSRFPSYAPKEYVPEISDGKIAVFFVCQSEKEELFVDAMTQIGADPVLHAEARPI
jgi:hypothetical protein